MDKSNRVDAHHHLWNLDERDQEWTKEMTVLHRSFGLNDLLPSLERNNFRTTVVVQTLNMDDETQDLLEIARTNPEVAGVIGWVNFKEKDINNELGRLKSQPGGEHLVGIRHLAQNEQNQEWTCSSDVLEGLKEVQNAGLAYDLVVRQHQIPSAIKAVQSLPNLRFVLDHFGKPLIREGLLNPWQSYMAELARSENVVVKLSGLVTEADHSHWRAQDLRPYFDVVLSEFGAQRIMFGSDWPVCQLAASYDEVVEVAEELTSETARTRKEQYMAKQPFVGTV